MRYSGLCSKFPPSGDKDCPYCKGKSIFLAGRKMMGGWCPHHVVLDAVRDYVGWVTDHPDEVITELAAGAVTFDLETPETPISGPPDTDFVPPRLTLSPASGTSEETTEGRMFTNVRTFLVYTESEETRIAKKDPEFGIILRLYGAGLLRL